MSKFSWILRPKFLVITGAVGLTLVLTIRLAGAVLPGLIGAGLGYGYARLEALQKKPKHELVETSNPQSPNAQLEDLDKRGS
jgi:hypothetical protein